MIKWLVVAILVSSPLVCGCSSEPAGSASIMKPRPVTVLTLEEIEFDRRSHLTGSVSLYREEQVGFEVGGRILAVLDIGTEVQGPAFDEMGTEKRPGEIIGQIDGRRYELQVRALGAQIESLQKQLDAQQIDVNQVATNDVLAAERDVDAAQSALTLAFQTLEREKEIFRRGAGSQQAVDDAQSEYDTALALKARSESALQSARGTLELKKARVEATRAEINQITQQREQAQEDLDDCTLIAPFTGRVTKVHTTQGAVVEAGTPIVTLSVMDPIQVQVAVSADEDRRIRTGDRATIYPKDPIDPERNPIEVHGIVYEKGAVADQATRTFRIDLMVRNRRRLIHQVAPETKDLPVVGQFMPVVRQYEGEAGPLYVQTSCIYEEDGQHYVLTLPGVSFNPDAQRGAVGKHIPEKVAITLGDEYFTVIKWNFRSLTSSGSLKEGDFLVVDPKPEHVDGLAIGRPQWLLRPGDLVPVNFLLEQTPWGFYIPVDAITTVEDKHAVFVVEKDAAENDVATLKDVDVHETFREWRRISGADVTTGVRVIVRGVHYLSDGQRVSVTGEENIPR